MKLKPKNSRQKKIEVLESMMKGSINFSMLNNKGYSWIKEGDYFITNGYAGSFKIKAHEFDDFIEKLGGNHFIVL
ncbi:MAG TPA: hypothetical protein VKR58_02050 [Aquella sp.]|nr:hypothetical protein [Aquella sp.]